MTKPTQLWRDIKKESQGVSAVEQELIHHGADLHEHENEIHLKDELIRRLRADIRSRNESIGKQEQKIAELEQLLSVAQSQAEELVTARRELGLIKNSTSWKVISHLRSGFDAYPKTRRLLRRIFRLAWWTVTLQLAARLRDRRRLFNDRELITNSPLFDADWYLQHYPDVAAAAEDPALHYALHGASEQRNPGPEFDAAWYLEFHSDIAAPGVNPLLHYLRHGISEGRLIQPVLEGPLIQPTDDYSRWVKLYDTITDDDADRIRRHLADLRATPLISVVMPVYNTYPHFLRKALDSMIAQLYPNWELCIADDVSPNPEIRTILEGYAGRDPRIKVAHRSHRGHIAAASNSALELVTGDFVALMDHDDEIPEHALYMVAVELNDHPDADIIYSDEDKLDARGRRHDPYFKTDWNQELFYSQNMISHLGVYRTSQVRQVAGFREGFEGSQDYDLALRIVARTTPDHIRHIPQVLYHWRKASGVQTYSTDNLPTAADASRRALADYFSARAERVQITKGNIPYWNRVKRFVPDSPPLVSLIVPTRDKVDILRTCIDGLLHKTSYPKLEIIIVDNESREPETLAYFESLASDSRVRVMRIEGAFNYSALNNRAVEISSGDLIGFVNNDIEVIDSGWLEEMVAEAVQPAVGAVGAKLYFSDDTIQHAGVTLGMGGVAGHHHSRHPRSDAGYFGRLQLVNNVSCVTAACMIMPTQVFREVGGFDEVNLAVAFNDVDLCLRVREAGYSIVWTPYAELYHLESTSRGYDHDDAEKFERANCEVSYMRRRWGKAIEEDPFYNPNLSLLSGNFDLAFPPRISKPWRSS